MISKSDDHILGWISLSILLALPYTVPPYLFEYLLVYHQCVHVRSMLSSGLVFDSQRNLNNELVSQFHIQRMGMSDSWLFLSLLVSCQTTLTLPTGFDIFQVLGKCTFLYCYRGDKCGQWY